MIYHHFWLRVVRPTWAMGTAYLVLNTPWFQVSVRRMPWKFLPRFSFDKPYLGKKEK